MSWTESKLGHELAAVAGEVIFILLGVGVLALGWTDFGEVMVALGAIGLVVSLVRLWRVVRPPADGPRLASGVIVKN